VNVTALTKEHVHLLDKHVLSSSRTDAADSQHLPREITEMVSLIDHGLISRTQRVSAVACYV
jgi:hypothetical protein